MLNRSEANYLRAEICAAGAVNFNRCSPDRTPTRGAEESVRGGGAVTMEIIGFEVDDTAEVGRRRFSAEAPHSGPQIHLCRRR